MEKQIKSKKRVRDFGEVFTNEREVKAMCDLIPSEVWENIESTFLEPCCGNGNFLVEIYARKLKHCNNEKDGLKALTSIFGIDIQEDNVIENRERLVTMYRTHFEDASEFAINFAKAVVANNIQCDDMLNPQTKIVKSWGITPNEQYIKKIKQRNLK